MTLRMDLACAAMAVLALMMTGVTTTRDGPDFRWPGP